MRILIVTPLLPPEYGGPSYYAVGLKEALERAGHTVDVVAFREVRRFPTVIRHLLFLYLVLWRGLRADVFIILDTVSVALPATIAGWLLFKKMIIRTGGDFVWEQYVERTKEKVLLSEFYKEHRALSLKEKSLIWLQKYIVFKLVHKIIFSTTWQRDIWASPYAIPEYKTAVIGNVFVSASDTVRKGRERHAVWIGRDLVLKNTEILDEAFKKIQEKHADVTIRKLANVSHEQVIEELKTALCLVLPSLSEISPNLVLEALSVGSPVVCTRDCGLREVLGNVVKWVDPLNAKNMADVISEIAMDSSLKNISVKEHTYDDVAREFLALI